MSDTRWCVVWPDPRSWSRRTKMADFMVYLLCCYACNQNTNGELWYSKLTFNWTDFWDSSSFDVLQTWPSNLGCSTFGKRILPLTRSRLAVLYAAYLSLGDVGLISGNFFIHCTVIADMEHHDCIKFLTDYWHVQGACIALDSFVILFAKCVFSKY